MAIRLSWDSWHDAMAFAVTEAAGNRWRYRVWRGPDGTWRVNRAGGRGPRRA